MSSYQLPLIPEGYRWVHIGETVQAGDLFFGENQHWLTTSLVGMRIDGSHYYIRKINEVNPSPLPAPPRIP